MSNTVETKRTSDLVQCPGCQRWIPKGLHGQRVVCAKCSRNLRRVYQFCWCCSREWPQDAQALKSCCLPHCQLRAALLSPDIITNRQTSVYGCPFFRVCPHCQALLTHTGKGCPNIICPSCMTHFCFRCLKIGFCFGRCTIVDNSATIRALRQ